MSIKTMLTAAAAALVLSVGAAVAQGTAPATTPAAKPAKAAPAKEPVKAAKAPAKPRSAESLKCSADADAKGLKGAERKKFRTKCMRDAKKAAGPQKAAAPAAKPAPKTN